MFKSWLVSNIEIFLGIILVCLSFFLFKDVTNAEGTNILIPALLYTILCYCIAIGISDTSFLGSLFLALVGLAIPVLAIFLAIKKPEFMIESSVITVSTVVAFACSIFIAIFAHKNFDDVVDSRWLFRTSDKDIYVAQWKYTINRFSVVIAFFDMGVILYAIKRAGELLA